MVPAALGPQGELSLPLQVQPWNRAVVLPTVPTGVMAMAEVMVYVWHPSYVRVQSHGATFITVLMGVMSLTWK